MMTREQAIEAVSELIKGYVCSLEVENIIVKGLEFYRVTFNSIDFKTWPEGPDREMVIRGIRNLFDAETNIRRWTKSKDALNMLLNEISC